MKALQIRGLTKRYANGVKALNRIDLEVARGDFFALLGPNGAGKSTTIGIITSLVTKTSGQVIVCGHDMDTELEAAKSCIGLVPQEFNFNVFEKCFDVVMTQAGYYGIPPRRALPLAEKYLKSLKLWDKRSQPVRNLSGGMKRRLMIARALISEPELLILDEPTAGVDIEIRRSMWDFLTEVNRQGTTIILTTHYLEEAEHLCKNIAIIDEGSIIKHCSIRELLSDLEHERYVLLTEPLPDPLPDIHGYTLTAVDEETLEVNIHRDQELGELFSLLTAAGIRVKSIRNKQNRLEQLFLRLVNRENSEITKK